ncbi:MAG: hypothetical protein NTZ80_04560 [Patescibacteria group bacterium]|nr:hypothetical protein [Patescibacteria group bacterium]
MEIFNYFRAIWHHKIIVLILVVACSVIAYFATALAFQPHFIGEYQFTVQLNGETLQDARSSDLFTNTVQGWLESSGFREKAGVDFGIKKTSWQNLILTFSAQNKDLLKASVDKVTPKIQEEVIDFNNHNNGILQISNEQLGIISAQSHASRNSIFGALFGLLLGMMISFLIEEID